MTMATVDLFDVIWGVSFEFADYFLFKGLIPQAKFFSEMRKFSREMNARVRSRGTICFARKNFVSLVSRSQFYALRKRNK